MIDQCAGLGNELSQLKLWRTRRVWGFLSSRPASYLGRFENQSFPFSFRILEKCKIQVIHYCVNADLLYRVKLWVLTRKVITGLFSCATF